MPGRLLYVAAGEGGLATVRETSAEPQLHPVSVENDFFLPLVLEIDMVLDQSVHTRHLWHLGAVGLFGALTALLATGCVGLPGNGGDGMDAPKAMLVRFDTFDVGTDDCEDIFSFGDFNVRMSVTIQPQNEEIFAANRDVSLGSASFQADVQSADLNESVNFELQPGESFDIEIRVTEDDPINLGEPQPWDESESFDFLTVTSRSLTFTNGPGCFRDDRVDIVVSVTE